MEEELIQLQNEVDELRKGFRKSKELIDQRINNRIEDIEKENGDIYSDEEIANLNMGLQKIEKEVNKKLEKLLAQIEEISEFENGKKDKINELNKKINEKIEKLTEQGYSYSDVYLDEEIQNMQKEIESIKKEKIVTKEELNEARNEYQDLKKEKQKIENEIENIEKTDISEHLLEEKKQREDEIKRLKSMGKDNNDPEIKEYLSDITRINEELEKSKVKSKEKKDKLSKIIKSMGKLEEKYGKDKLDEPEKKKEQKDKESKQQTGKTNTETAQTATQTTVTNQEPSQTATQTTATNQELAQTATQTTAIQENITNAKNKEVNIEFTSQGIWCDNKWIDIRKIDNLHDFVENEKENGNVSLSFDLRGMSFISRALKNCSLTKDQVKQIKDFAFENRGNSNITHGLFTKLEFKVKETILKLQKEKLLSSKNKQEIKQIPQYAESIHSSHVDRDALLSRLDARDVANIEKVDKQSANVESEKEENFETVITEPDQDSER